MILSGLIALSPAYPWRGALSSLELLMCEAISTGHKQAGSHSIVHEPNFHHFLLILERLDTSKVVMMNSLACSAALHRESVLHLTRLSHGRKPCWFIIVHHRSQPDQETLVLSLCIRLLL